jgi:hypothetical protein
MRLTVANPQWRDQALCFWLDKQMLGCEPLSGGQIQLDVVFDHDIPFSITHQERVIFQQTLRVNSIAGKKRRRIRLPWSLF